MIDGGAENTSAENARYARSRRHIRYSPRRIHQQNPTTAAPLKHRHIAISTGPITCVTRSSRMNDVPQTKLQKIKARWAKAGQGGRSSKMSSHENVRSHTHSREPTASPVGNTHQDE